MGTRARKAAPISCSQVTPAEIAAQLVTLSQHLGTSNHSLGEAVRAFRKARVREGLLKPASVRAYTMALRRLEERWGGLCLQTTDWEREGADLLALSGRQAWRELQTLRMVLIHAGRLGWRSGPHGLDALLRRAEYTPRDDVYTEQQVLRLLEALDRLDTSATLAGRACDVIRTLVWTGCRINEICRLQEPELRGDHLRLRDSKTGARTIPLCLEAQQILHAQRPHNGWIFPGTKTHISDRTVLATFHRARTAAGLRYGTPHTIRHSWATITIRSGTPPQAVQRVLGHSSSWMTARYVHLSERDARLATISFAAQLKR